MKRGARISLLSPTAPLVWHALERDALTLGRDVGNDVVVADPMVSRRHLYLRRDGAGWIVEDLGSKHGTLLEGRPLRGSAPLTPGARLVIGRTEMRFEASGASEVAATASAAPSSDDDGPRFIGAGTAMQAVRAMLTRLAASPSPVLLLGESGTGKEIAARMLHHLSPRADQPFVVVNCPALAPALMEAELFGIEKNVATGVAARSGKLEQADGGTLFLDELGDLDLGAQAKLLRFVQERKVERVGGRALIAVNARVVAATHHDLTADVAAGRFRLDLYYRLNTLVVHLPALRDRREDIPALVEHCVGRLCGGRRVVSAEAMDRLMRHDFPGNVRELEALVTRAVLLSDGPIIGPEAFEPAPSRVTAPLSPIAPPGGEVRALLRRLERGESFWSAVHGPFLQRALAADTVREVVGALLAAAGGSYRQAAARVGITDFKEYKKWTDFIRHHQLHSRRAEPM